MYKWLPNAVSCIHWNTLYMSGRYMGANQWWRSIPPFHYKRI